MALSFSTYDIEKSRVNFKVIRASSCIQARTTHVAGKLYHVNSPGIGVLGVCCQQDMMVTVVAEAIVSNEMCSARFADVAETQAPLLLKQVSKLAEELFP